MAFDSGDYMQQATSSIDQSGDTIEQQTDSTYGNGYRSVGQPAPVVAPTAIQNVNNLPDMPIDSSVNVNGASQTLSPPATDPLNNIIGEVTGINIAQTFTPTGGQLIGNQINSAIQVLESQIVDEIQQCITSKLTTLSRTNPIVDLFFNYNYYKSQILGEITLAIDRAISKEVNDILYNKLQLQEIALLRQQILSEVRKLCPDASPTLVRNYVTNPTSVNNAATQSASSISSTIKQQASTPATTGSKSWSSLVK